MCRGLQDKQLNLSRAKECRPNYVKDSNGKTTYVDMQEVHGRTVE